MEVVVHDVPRIHCRDGIYDDIYLIISNKPLLNILLQFEGFFFFNTKRMTADRIDSCDDMDAICLTLDWAAGTL